MKTIQDGTVEQLPQKLLVSYFNSDCLLSKVLY